MDTAKIFQTGRSQAVRLPKAYRFSGQEVFIKKTKQGVLLIPKDDAWALVRQAITQFEPGLQLERDQPLDQNRPALRFGSPTEPLLKQKTASPAPGK